jgi:hypothetical protein
MEAMIHFAGLAVATMFAAATAVALDWLLLRTIFGVLQPARARRSQALRAELVNATRELARHMAPQGRM